ncbi:sarcosine oxidase subunit alpha family protein [Litorivicinus lipolyticus]|uniref:sarcosine oxidase subunit alpha family protein n=1 Tax=Litorivicinus lipolyticus TaxID=418701 RepID=UPI003B59F764
MSQGNRLPQGGRINRGKPVNFKYRGKSYQGFEGDSLASALLANGINLVGRSFKYGRPRGIMAAGADEPNALLQLGASEATQVPNVRATQQELFDGLVCEPVSGWPSVEFDLKSIAGTLGGSLMAPGFYYKTFMWPAKLWMTYEHYIRKAAGLGRSPLETDPDQYDVMNQHCDLLVVGGGPAGLAAALTAGRGGKRVLLVDEQNEWGGYLLASPELIDGQPAMQWVDAAVAELHAMANVELMTRATANGYHDHSFVTVHQRLTEHLSDRAPVGQVRSRMHRVRAHEVILATGAHERPLVYGNNDIPGCMVAGAISTYIRRYGVRPGQRLVVMTTNDYGYQCAIDWAASGGTVVAVVDTRANPESATIGAARDAGLTVLTGQAVIDVRGGKAVEGVYVAPISADGNRVDGPVRQLQCDTVGSSGGYSPVVHLSAHLGCRPLWDQEKLGFVPNVTFKHLHCAGGVEGEYALGTVLARAIERAAAACDVAPIAPPRVEDVAVAPAMALFQVPHTARTSRAPKQFVDYQNDVTASAIELACQEGFESIEHVKRYTALGFGTDQGKLSNINGVAITAKALNKPISETGTTMFRPNYTPVTFGAIAGRNAAALFDPKRYTAMQPWHEAQGAMFEDVGQWKRPWYFPQHGETLDQAVNREAKAVRDSVGILDASTLGKIDVQGPDAREFMGRVYTNAWAKLGIGKCRYGLMCGEDGMLFDDGVTACLGDNHFIMTTTTGGAARVYEWLELWHQTEWPELEVYFNTVTDQWATTTISGPNSRKVLQKLTDAELSGEAFKFMDWQAATIAGVPGRIFRISFTGEASYEINVPAHYGLHVWEAAIEAGAEFNITPYGTETMHVLRAEKGFIIAGQDTDGSVHPFDLNHGWAVGMKKPFPFIGKRGMQRADCVRDDRKQLVGLKTIDPKAVLQEGAQAVFDPNGAIPMTMVGHVTSSYWSPNCGHSIAMALIKGGLNRMGEKVYFPGVDGRTIEAEICSPVFFDPEGARQNV